MHAKGDITCKSTVEKLLVFFFWLREKKRDLKVHNFFNSGLFAGYFFLII